MAIAASTLGSCGEESASEGAAPSCPSDTAGVQQQILTPRCGLSACHDSDEPAQGLDLISPGLEARVAGTVGACARPIVVPGDPDASYLLSKVRLATLSCGQRMPLDQAPLEPEAIECLEQWIAGLRVDSGTDGPPATTADAAGVPGLDAAAGGDAGAVVVSPCDEGQVLCGTRCIAEIPPTLDAIFTSTLEHGCVFDSCHGGLVPKEGLDLSTPDSAYSHLVGVASRQRPELQLVEPGHPERSYLVNKLRGVDLAATDSAGLRPAERMPQPPNTPLCEEKIRVIEEWIRGGALRL
jgi:hypothetical protein